MLLASIAQGIVIVVASPDIGPGDWKSTLQSLPPPIKRAALTIARIKFDLLVSAAIG